MPRLGRAKGGKKYGGRVKGTPNKYTKDVREVIRAAFDELGGQGYLVRIGKTDPRTFMGAFTKIVPLHHVAQVEITHEQALKMLDDDEGEIGE